MKTDLKALEARVGRVLDRLGAVTRERDRLQEEVASLREQLEALEAQDPGGSTRGALRADWSARLADVESALRASARELRGE